MLDHDLQPRNLASKLLMNLRSQHAQRDKKNKQEPVLDWIEQLLSLAVHFVLPDGGRILNAGGKALDDLQRLPFPVVALEYVVTQAGEQSVAGITLVPCPLRVALAVDLEQCNSRPTNVNHIQELIKRSGMDFSRGILIFSCSYSDHDQQWTVLPGAMLLDTDALVSDQAEIKAAVEFNRGLGIPTSWKIRSQGYKSIIVPVSILALYQLATAYGRDRAYVMTLADLSDEVTAVYEFLEASSCSNVTSKIIAAAPKSLNKKRELTGKPPIFEYRVLTLTVPEIRDARSGDVASKDKRESPRVHLRRGHIRRLTDKKIWVNAAVIGSKEQGILNKDYRVQTANS